MGIPSPSYSYNAAKAGRIEVLKLAAKEVWRMGVTVNIIGPGPVEEFSELEEAAAFCRHKNERGEGSKVTPQDIAEGVAFLCSDSASYITGCILPYLF